MFWRELLSIFIFAIISLLLFQLVRPYIINKFNIKKRYVFILLIILFILPTIFYKIYNYKIVTYIHFILVTFTVLYYMELARVERERKNRPVIGRPKPKLNRVKDKR
jgi:hypothetical protein